MQEHSWTSVFHIGASKCGSSSIQRALSLKPQFSSKHSSRMFRYFALQPVGQMGPFKIKRRMAKSIASGFPSHNFIKLFVADHDEAIPTLNMERVMQVRQLIQDQNEAKITPIFSSEGIVDILRENFGVKLFQELQINPLFFLYIRPQVEFINSAWWQWGVWKNIPFSRWYHGKLCKAAKWNSAITNFRQLHFDHEVHVGICSENVVENFFNKLSVDLDPSIINQRTNTSLSTDAISFLLRNRRYRQGPHSNRADTILGRLKSLQNEPSPWCLTRQHVEEIIKVNKDSNYELLKLLPNNVAEKIEADPKWWSADAYSDKQLWDWTRPQSSQHAISDADIIKFLTENGFS